jgi:hypothetical protein
MMRGGKAPLRLGARIAAARVGAGPEVPVPALPWATLTGNPWCRSPARGRLHLIDTVEWAPRSGALESEEVKTWSTW